MIGAAAVLVAAAAGVVVGIALTVLIFDACRSVVSELYDETEGTHMNY